jgi:hypothetical protein
MDNKTWSEMTPLERMTYASKAMENPCADGQHKFEDTVNTLGDDTMLQQFCKVCFTIQGWIYPRES